jgi:hypothetical protein
MSQAFSNSRGSSLCPWQIVGRKLGGKNLQQQINFKVCAMIGKHASETLALLRVDYDEYSMKK